MSPMPDSPPPDERSDRSGLTISSFKQLPRGGYHLPLYDELDLKPEEESKMAVWSVLPRGSEERVTGKPVWLVAAEGFEQDIKFYSIKRALTRAGYKVERTVKADKTLVRMIRDSGDGSAEEPVSQKNAITEFYEEMISAALRERVSDIHIERRKSSARIRMRQHGQMMDYKEAISTKFALDLCTVIYNVLAENKDVSFRPSIFQSAAVNTRIQSEEVKLRYQSLPVYPDGFDVVLRVLPLGGDEEGTPDLSVLGYSPNQVQDLMKIVSKPVGALVIAGTTGSGKSTTLKNLLMLINESRGYRCKIFTIEDPPEYKIPKVSQIPVVRRQEEDYSKKSPFEDPLVATMRADPDILMIGEIRDGFTGDGLKKATQSGHQVLTTIHTSSALGTTERLADFGITPSVMGSPEFINGLVYQKLLPILCPSCSTPFSKKIEGSASTQADLDLATRLQVVADLARDNIRIRNPRGCDKCKGLGVVGRTVCAEVVIPDFVLLRHFRNQASLEAKAYWRSLSDGDPNSDNMTGKTVLEHALVKMRRGIVSPQDIEDLLGPVDAAEKSWQEISQIQGLEIAGHGKGAGTGTASGWDPGYSAN